MSIPGFGPAYTQKLVMWREGLKARFVFNKNKGVNPLDRQKVEMDIASSRLQLERLLQHKVTQLRAQTANINAKNQYLTTKAQELSGAYAQAQSNKSAVSSLSWATGTAFLLAIVIPAGGGIIQFASNLPSPPVVNNAVTTPTPIVGMTNTPQNINSNSFVAVNSNITKQEGKSKKVKGKSENQDRSSPEQFFMPENFYSPAYFLFIAKTAVVLINGIVAKKEL